MSSGLLQNFPPKCSEYFSIFSRKPLDGFANLSVNMVTSDIFVNSILLQQFHDFMLDPGQMDLYPDLSHILGDLVQHIGALKIDIVDALHIDQHHFHRWDDISCHLPDLVAQGIGSGEKQGTVEANDDQPRIGFAVRVFVEL